MSRTLDAVRGARRLQVQLQRTEDRATEYRTDRDTWRAVAVLELVLLLASLVALVLAWRGQ